MKCGRFLFFVFCLLFLFASPVVAQQSSTQNLSTAIKEKLVDLKANSIVVTEQLLQLQSDLKASQLEVSQWKERSTNLSNSLMSINEQLTDCYTTITRQEARLKSMSRIVCVLLIVLILRTLGMIAGYIIYAKGIKLPRWLDILL